MKFFTFRIPIIHFCVINPNMGFAKKAFFFTFTLYLQANCLDIAAQLYQSDQYKMGNELSALFETLDRLIPTTQSIKTLSINNNDPIDRELLKLFPNAKINVYKPIQSGKSLLFSIIDEHNFANTKYFYFNPELKRRGQTETYLFDLEDAEIEIDSIIEKLDESINFRKPEGSLLLIRKVESKSGQGSLNYHGIIPLNDRSKSMAKAPIELDGHIGLAYSPDFKVPDEHSELKTILHQQDLSVVNFETSNIYGVPLQYRLIPLKNGDLIYLIMGARKTHEYYLSHLRLHRRGNDGYWVKDDQGLWKRVSFDASDERLIQYMAGAEGFEPTTY